MVSSVSDLEAYACLADSATGIVISNRRVRMTAEGNNFLDKLQQTFLLQFIFVPGCDSEQCLPQQAEFTVFLRNT